MTSSETIQSAVLNGEAETAAALAREMLTFGMERLDALQPFIAAIRHAGDLFEQGDFFLPQLLLASNAMKAALDVIFPRDAQEESGIFQGTVLAGTVQGDIHEIGKNLVCALLTAHGFKVIDLGGDVALSRFLEQIRVLKPDLLALSALLTTTMIQQQRMIELLEEADLRKQVKVMVGGAPVTSQWAQSIGADGYAPDAARAVDLAFSLLGKSRA
jgi:corrinoid protein of di/trimethylamine methyltransferase